MSCLSEKRGEGRRANAQRHGISRIAAQMLSLWNEADQLSRADDSPHLSVATVDSFLDYNLTPLYRDLVSLHGFSLDIKCYPADMIYALVAKNRRTLASPSTTQTTPT